MELPSDVIIKASIKQGVIYYFQENSFKSDEPHYFVVLNRNGSEDNFIYLVNATSQIDKALMRIKIQKLPSETLVILEPSDCPVLTKKSAFDCNSLTKKHIKELIRLVDEKILHLKGEMPSEHVMKILEGIKKSTLVENRVKRII